MGKRGIFFRGNRDRGERGGKDLREGKGGKDLRGGRGNRS